MWKAAFTGRSERDGGERDKDRGSKSEKSDDASKSSRRHRSGSDAGTVVSSASRRTEGDREKRRKHESASSSTNKRGLTESAVGALNKEGEDDWEEEGDRRSERRSKRKEEEEGREPKRRESDMAPSSDKKKSKSRAGESSRDIVDRGMPASGSLDQFPGMNAGAVVRPPQMTMHDGRPYDSHVASQFPGQNPATFAASDFMPNPHGEAADYYNDTGESVHRQPGVRASTPMMLHNPDTHLITPLAVEQPVADTGHGAAADFFADAGIPASVTATSSASKPPRSTKQSSGLSSSGKQPKKPSRTSSLTGAAAALIGGAGIAAATSSLHSESKRASSYSAQASVSGGRGSQTPPTYTGPPRPSRHNTEPVAAPGGGYYVQPPAVTGRSGLYATGGVAAAGMVAYGMSQQQSQYATSDGRYGAPSMPGPSMQYSEVRALPESELRAMHEHEHKGPITRLKDGFLNLISNPEDVRKMEEYTEYIGVCKYCFDPRSTPYDGPRKHHFHNRKRDSFEDLRRRSIERLRRRTSSERVDKENRYYSGRKSASKTDLLAGGLAAAGVATAGGAMFNDSKNFDDTYSVKSGYRAESIRRRGSSSSRERRGGEHGVISDRREDWVTVRTKDGKLERRRRHRSRSHSGNRGSTMMGAAADAALGAGAIAAASGQRGDISPERVFVRHGEKQHSRSRSNSPGTGQIFGFSGSASKRSDRRSPDRTRPDRVQESTGILGGFFSPSSGRSGKVENGKKSKGTGFFSFSNGSSLSSDGGLAFGAEGITSRSSLGRKSSRSSLGRTSSNRNGKRPVRKSSDERMNTAMLGIGATAAALAVAQNRQRVGKKQSRPDLGGRRDLRQRPSLGQSRVSSRPAEDEGWEDETPSSDDGMSGLAFGDDDAVRSRLSRQSMDSIGSKSSDGGLGAWGWRWGGKGKKRRKDSVPNDDPYGSMVGGGAVAATTIAGAAYDARDRPLLPQSSHESSTSIPQKPLQYVDPRPFADSIGSRQASMPGAFDVSFTSLDRPGPGPIQQPQPISPFQPSFTRPDFNGSISATAGPRRSMTEPTWQAPPSSFAKDAAVIGGTAALVGAGVMAAQSLPSSKDRDRGKGNVSFGFTEEQQRKADDEARSERKREEESRRRADRTRALKEEAERVSREEDARAQAESRRHDDERRLQDAREREEQERRKRDEDRRRTEARERQEQEELELQRKESERREEAYRREQARLQAEERARSEAAEASRRDRDVDAQREQEQRRQNEDRERARREVEERERARREVEERERSRRDRESREREAADSEQRDRDLQQERDRGQEPTNKSAWHSAAAAGIAGALVGSVAAGAMHKHTDSDDERDEYRSRDMPASKPAYIAQTITPSNEHSGAPITDDDLIDPDLFKRRRAESNLTRRADIARKAAEKILAEREEYYNAPETSQRDFFMPKELLDREPEGKEHAASPLGDNDVHVYNAVEDVPSWGPAYGARRSVPEALKYSNIPMLNVIAPTPPHSTAGSVRGDRSMPSSPLVQAQDAEKHDGDDGRPTNGARGVSWGEDKTHVYEVRTPDSYQEPAGGDYVSAGGYRTAAPSHDDEYRTVEPGHDEIVVETEDLTGSTKRTTYGADDLPKAAPNVFDFLVRDQQQTPGTAGAPPVRGWVEGETDEPTPREEKMPHIPGGFDDDVPAVVHEEEPAWEAPVSKKDKKKKRDKSSKAGESEPSTPARDDTARQIDLGQSTADYFGGGAKQSDEGERDERLARKVADAFGTPTPSATAAVAEDTWEPPLSKKEQKKRDKERLAREAAAIDQPTTGAGDLGGSTTLPDTGSASREAQEESAWEPPLSKKEQKKRDKERLAREAAALDEAENQRQKATDQPPETIVAPADTRDVQPEQDDLWEAPLSKKEQKKRDKERLAREAFDLDEPATPSNARDAADSDDFSRARIDPEPAAESAWEPPLSKKEQKKRDKERLTREAFAVHDPTTPNSQRDTAEVDDFARPRDDPEPVAESAWEPPLSKKELKKREQAAKQGIDSELSTPALQRGTSTYSAADEFATPLEEPSAWEPPLSKKELKKREKAAKAGAFADESEPATPIAERELTSRTADDSATPADDVWEAPLSKKELKKREKAAKAGAFADDSEPATPVAERELAGQPFDDIATPADDAWEAPISKKEQKKREKDAKKSGDLDLGSSVAVAAGLAAAADTVAKEPDDAEAEWSSSKKDKKSKKKKLGESWDVDPRDSGSTTPTAETMPGGWQESSSDATRDVSPVRTDATEPSNDFAAIETKTGKKKKRDSSCFGDNVASSPLRAEVPFDDYSGTRGSNGQAEPITTERTSDTDGHSRDEQYNNGHSTERNGNGGDYFGSAAPVGDSPRELSPRNEPRSVPSSPSDERRHRRPSRSTRDGEGYTNAPQSVPSSPSDERRRARAERKSTREGDEYSNEPYTYDDARSVAASESTSAGSKSKHRSRTYEDDDAASTVTSRSKRDKPDAPSGKKEKKGGILGLFSRKQSDPPPAPLSRTSMRESKDSRESAENDESGHRRHRRHRTGSEYGDDKDDSRSVATTSGHRHRYRDGDSDNESRRDDDGGGEDRHKHRRHRSERTEEDQSFLDMRVEELPPLPASRPASPFAAPRGSEGEQSRGSSSFAVIGDDATTSTRGLDGHDMTGSLLPLTTEPDAAMLPPIPDSRPESPVDTRSAANVLAREPLEHLPALPVSRPESPTEYMSRPTAAGRLASTTAVPLRFRQPPFSPAQPRERSSSFDASAPSTPMSPDSTQRTKAARPRSSEFRNSSEFRPLYLVSRNSKIEDIEEQLPSLPSSKPSSRASSVQGSDEWHSAAESVTNSPVATKRALTIDASFANEYTSEDDILGSAHSTPKARTFSASARDPPVAKQEPQFYTWDDFQRDERLHDEAAREGQDATAYDFARPPLSQADIEDAYETERKVSPSRMSKSDKRKYKGLAAAAMMGGVAGALAARDRDGSAERDTVSEREDAGTVSSRDLAASVDQPTASDTASSSREFRPSASALEQAVPAADDNEWAMPVTSKKKGKKVKKGKVLDLSTFADPDPVSESPLSTSQDAEAFADATTELPEDEDEDEPILRAPVQSASSKKKGKKSRRSTIDETPSVATPTTATPAEPARRAEPALNAEPEESFEDWFGPPSAKSIDANKRFSWETPSNDAAPVDRIEHGDSQVVDRDAFMDLGEPAVHSETTSATPDSPHLDTLASVDEAVAPENDHLLSAEAVRAASHDSKKSKKKGKSVFSFEPEEDSTATHDANYTIADSTSLAGVASLPDSLELHAPSQDSEPRGAPLPMDDSRTGVSRGLDASADDESAFAPVGKSKKGKKGKKQKVDLWAPDEPMSASEDLLKTTAGETAQQPVPRLPVSTSNLCETKKGNAQDVDTEAARGDAAKIPESREFSHADATPLPTSELGTDDQGARSTTSDSMPYTSVDVPVMDREQAVSAVGQAKPISKSWFSWPFGGSNPAKETTVVSAPHVAETQVSQDTAVSHDIAVPHDETASRRLEEVLAETVPLPGSPRVAASDANGTRNLRSGSSGKASRPSLENRYLSRPEIYIQDPAPGAAAGREEDYRTTPPDVVQRSDESAIPEVARDIQDFAPASLPLPESPLESAMDLDASMPQDDFTLLQTSHANNIGAERDQGETANATSMPTERSVSTPEPEQHFSNVGRATPDDDIWGTATTSKKSKEGKNTSRVAVGEGVESQRGAPPSHQDNEKYSSGTPVAGVSADSVALDLTSTVSQAPTFSVESEDPWATPVLSKRGKKGKKARFDFAGVTPDSLLADESVETPTATTEPHLGDDPAAARAVPMLASPLAEEETSWAMPSKGKKGKKAKKAVMSWDDEESTPSPMMTSAGAVIEPLDALASESVTPLTEADAAAMPSHIDHQIHRSHSPIAVDADRSIHHDASSGPSDPESRSLGSEFPRTEACTSRGQHPDSMNDISGADSPLQPDAEESAMIAASPDIDLPRNVSAHDDDADATHRTSSPTANHANDAALSTSRDITSGITDGSLPVNDDGAFEFTVKKSKKDKREKGTTDWDDELAPTEIQSFEAVGEPVSAPEVVAGSSHDASIAMDVDSIPTDGDEKMADYGIVTDPPAEDDEFAFMPAKKGKKAKNAKKTSLWDGVREIADTASDPDRMDAVDTEDATFGMNNTRELPGQHTADTSVEAGTGETEPLPEWTAPSKKSKKDKKKSKKAVAWEDEPEAIATPLSGDETPAQAFDDIEHTGKTAHLGLAVTTAQDVPREEAAIVLLEEWAPASKKSKKDKKKGRKATTWDGDPADTATPASGSQTPVEVPGEAERAAEVTTSAPAAMADRELDGNDGAVEPTEDWAPASKKSKKDKRKGKKAMSWEDETTEIPDGFTDPALNTAAMDILVEPSQDKKAEPRMADNDHEPSVAPIGGLRNERTADIEPVSLNVGSSKKAKEDKKKGKKSMAWEDEDLPADGDSAVIDGVLTGGEAGDGAHATDADALRPSMNVEALDRDHSDESGPCNVMDEHAPASYSQGARGLEHDSQPHGRPGMDDVYASLATDSPSRNSNYDSSLAYTDMAPPTLGDHQELERNNDASGEAVMPPQAHDGDDVDFAATLAAGLSNSGFDPNVVIDDPTYHRRASPPAQVAEADPEEFFSTVKRNKKGKGKKAETVADSQDSRGPTQSDDFDALLAQGLQDSGFDRSLLKSSDAPSDPASAFTEADEADFSFPISRGNKSKRKQADASPGSTDHEVVQHDHGEVTIIERRVPLIGSGGELGDDAIEADKLVASLEHGAEDVWAMPVEKSKKGKQRAAITGSDSNTESTQCSALPQPRSASLADVAGPNTHDDSPLVSRGTDISESATTMQDRATVPDDLAIKVPLEYIVPESAAAKVDSDPFDKSARSVTEPQASSEQEAVSENPVDADNFSFSTKKKGRKGKKRAVNFDVADATELSSTTDTAEASATEASDPAVAHIIGGVGEQDVDDMDNAYKAYKKNKRKQKKLQAVAVAGASAEKAIADSGDATGERELLASDQSRSLPSTGNVVEPDTHATQSTSDGNPAQAVEPDVSGPSGRAVQPTSPTSPVEKLFPGLKRVKRRTASIHSPDADGSQAGVLLHTSEVSQFVPTTVEKQPSPQGNAYEASTRIDDSPQRLIGQSSPDTLSRPRNVRYGDTMSSPTAQGVQAFDTAGTPITPPTWEHVNDLTPTDRNSENYHRQPLAAPSWSFDVLDAQSDANEGLAAKATGSGAIIRDSGYHEVVSPATDRRSVGEGTRDLPTIKASASRDSLRSRRSAEPLHIDTGTSADWALNVPRQRAEEKDTTAGAHGRARSDETPLESTSRNRASYLFQSPPANLAEIARSLPSNNADVASASADYFKHRSTDSAASSEAAESLRAATGPLSPRSPLNTIDEEPHARKRSPAESSIAVTPSDHGGKALRRTETPRATRVRTLSPLSSRDNAGPRSIGRSLADGENHGAGPLSDSKGTKRSPSDARSASVVSNRSNVSATQHRTPEDRHSISRASNRSSTPILRRVNLSGDLRAVSRASNRVGESGSGVSVRASPNTIPFQPPPTPPLNDEDDYVDGASRAVGMADVFQGYGDGHGSQTSPTRPPSMRKRQSMHIMELESQLDHLTSENRNIKEARSRGLDGDAMEGVTRDASLQLREKDNEIQHMNAMLVPLQQEIDRLAQINADLMESNRNLVDGANGRFATLQSEHGETRQQWESSTRELEQVRQENHRLTSGMRDAIAAQLGSALADKDHEIRKLREDLEIATERIRALQVQIQSSRASDYLVSRDEDYFDGACQKLCQHVQQWVLRFSKASDNRICRISRDIRDEKIETRLDNALLDGSDVDKLLGDRVKRRDVFMSVVMTMVWEYVFTRYLFGMDREQRQKLKALEKVLAEVGPARAVAQWRATTLTLLSKRPSFAGQCKLDTEAVAHEVFGVLCALLPPPSTTEQQLLTSLQKVIGVAVDLSIEMRVQRSEYIMLPPLQPEYDTNGELVRKVNFNASLMNERSGAFPSMEKLEAEQAIVKIVLFPLVVKKGDESGEGEEEIVVCPAQVLVHNDGGKGKKVVRVMSGAMEIDDPRRSRQSLFSEAPGSTQA
ncbi:hypothetical protein B0A48_05636 [Cryoendolithus antarcticus]|uniref:Involucrin repeat protein n=1 Tax=Cryoendolithus antarcticus TaxID=1507870 RepID=A0A1V8TJ27_9PEZI|nr:hypothetical protein B0A48_05636 [Cryoendolithus antarcticus]